jgi:hypothetical protein
VQGGGASGGQFGFEPLADGRVGAGEVEVTEGPADVKTRPADQDRHPPARGNVVDGGPGQALITGHVGGLPDVPDVQHVVRYAVPVVRRELGGPDVHAPVNLHRVGIDHLTAESQGQRDRECRFACRSRAHHGDDLTHPPRGPGESHLPGERRRAGRPRVPR